MTDISPLRPTTSEPLKPRQESAEAKMHMMNPLLKLTDGLAAVSQNGAGGSEIAGAPPSGDRPRPELKAVVALRE